MYGLRYWWKELWNWMQDQKKIYKVKHGREKDEKVRKNDQREVIKTDVLGETDLESQKERLQKIWQKYHGWELFKTFFLKIKL